MRLSALRYKRDLGQMAKKKCEAGVPLSAFVDFSVVGEFSLSL
jgi:hypothetical protein